MIVYYKAENRKPLVQAISEFVGVKAVYMKTPTYAYKIGHFTVTREGNLEFEDMSDRKEIERLIEYLAEKGFVADTVLSFNANEEVIKDSINEPHSGNLGLTVSMPRDKVSIENLTKILETKGELIKKANNKEAYDEIAEQIFKLREQRQQCTVDTAARDAQIARITELQDFIKEQCTDLAEFDESLVKRWFKQITVWNDHFTVGLKSGLSIDIEG